MGDAYQVMRDTADKLVKYLQSINIAEIRQSMEFIGAHQVEVVVGVLVFLALQFTKFTAVLLLACLIAFTIFYMWDTLFPDLTDDYYQKRFINGPDTYGAGYGPRYANDRAVGTSTPYLNFQAAAQDARTSALFPPFNATDEDQLHGYQDEKMEFLRDRGAAAPPSRDRMRPQRRSYLSGHMTPVGHRGSVSDLRSHRRPYNQIDEYRYLRRSERANDPQVFRRMIASEYRAYRPGTATENLNHHRHQYPNDETKMKRIGTQSTADDKQSKNRRTSDKSTSHKRYVSSEMPERYRYGSRDNMMRRLRHFSQGPLPHSSGAHGRFDTSGLHGNTEGRGTKRRADYQYSKRESRLGQ
ncbi:uncharacterized protein LOC111594593 isoform X2 [Drosophila hydei]|uniref:Uncharacterized protein LOC111594593 isoform X2 n=1 Tax=Drosophila hydei TaxID=7224 RepID=A0A6J1LCC9_DROHY|nr:uncharacterized protein LOC111594593 isoform X2 [Drosophila hydei]